MKMKKLYAFDVDDTLDLSSGPISWDVLEQLREDGHIVGLCGNWAKACYMKRDWHKTISFIGPMAMTKEQFLSQLKDYLQDVSEFVMVGNDHRDTKRWPNGVSADGEAADKAGVRFISEDDFARGIR
jgi:hypothetical protein